LEKVLRVFKNIFESKEQVKKSGKMESEENG
jgi:hypothetical protein